MNILIVGVGGQGTLLTSRVLGKYAELGGLDCKLSEVHGMAQRGGSVVTHVRMGEKLYSPIIWEGGADVIIAFEKLEAMRYAHYLKKGGVLLVNDMEIYPMPVITGAVKYPADVKEVLSGEYDAKFVAAAELSAKAGSIKAVNTVMLGALCSVLGLDLDKMKEACRLSVPEKFAAMNLAALQLGYDSMK